MEVDYNTDNAQYRPSEYSNYVEFMEENVVKKLQEKITHFADPFSIFPYCGCVLELV